MGDYLRRLVAAAEFVLSSDRQAEADTPIDPVEFGVSATLKQHQVEGVSWLIRRHLVGANVILGDEMGLGKTLQAISFLNYLKIKLMSPGPFLVLCPLSVTDSWMSEFSNFCPTLKVLRYIGDKEYRRGLRRALFEDVKRLILSSDGQLGLSFDVLLTTYDIAMLDKDFLSQIPWQFSVIDEAQRLKNSSSVLYNVLEQQFIMPRGLLMTGTPIQNNLSELWALMHFCLPLLFGTSQQFLSTFKEKGISSTGSTEADVKGSFKILKYILKAFMLRRTKLMLVENGALELPSLVEVTVMVPLVSLQKNVYFSILRRELPKLLAFSSGASTHQSLQNMVIQLRKACSHPYLFNGIEPEPFEEGEHLVQASGKLIVLDLLLRKLQKLGHRVLLFAQMTHTLDILQDFLELRSYTYERLDGSVRAEERFTAIRSFSVAGNPSDNQDNTFVFMISTRAGGVGLNLVAADTVIFYEQDWNPQVDKQALQRAHRIGQRNNVLSIRLVSECTIEEVIMRRAESKLHLSDEVVGVDDAHGETKMGSEISHDIRSLIFGLHIFDPAASDNNAYELDMAELDKMAEVVLEMRHCETSKDNEQKFEVNSKGLSSGSDLHDNRNSTSIHLDPGIDEAAYLAWVEKFKGVSQTTDSALDIGKRITLSEDSRVRHEAKMRIVEEKKLAKWEALGYKSLAVKEPINTAGSDITQDAGCVQFVYGDCTKPSKLCPSEPTIIFSCVDDSGNWGHGGMFDALANISDAVPNSYRHAHEFGDLHLGDLHLIQINGSSNHTDTLASAPQWVALAVVQSYNPRRKVPRSNISLDALERCLSKASMIASQNSASIHMPRIGYQGGSQHSEWYTVERLLRKYSAIYGIKILVYYFRRQT